jgi:hypothetical protein
MRMGRTPATSSFPDSSASTFTITGDAGLGDGCGSTLAKATSLRDFVRESIVH